MMDPSPHLKDDPDSPPAQEEGKDGPLPSLKGEPECPFT